MKKSFTLIELLIVIAIIAIMAVGIIVLIIPGERLAQARDATRAAHLKNLETALYLYDLDHGLSNLTITENLTEICNTELENYNCTGLIDLSSLSTTIPTDPLGGNSPNGTGYYLALINNKAVFYATKAETKEIKIGIPEGVTFIYTWEDLDNIRNGLEDHYILMNNLSSATDGYDTYAGPSANGGEGWEPIGNFTNKFTGIFNGQGYTISNLHINRSTTSWIGLFGYVDTGGEISNIGVVDVSIVGEGYVGGLVGDLRGTILNSYSTGELSGVYTIGGLVGLENGGIINNSYSEVNVDGDDGAGGLVSSSYGDILNSYATGNVSGTEYIGGLIGLSYGPITNSYATGNVSGITEVGGLVGSNIWGIITDSFYDTNTSGRSDTGKGEPRTTAQMRNILNYTDPNFPDTGEGPDTPWNIVLIQNYTNQIWKINDGIDYPRLGWQ